MKEIKGKGLVHTSERKELADKNKYGTAAQETDRRAFTHKEKQ